MPEPRGVASVKIMDAAKRRLFRPTAWLEVRVGRNKRRNGFTILGKRVRRAVPACGGFEIGSRVPNSLVILRLQHRFHDPLHCVPACFDSRFHPKLSERGRRYRTDTG